MQKKLIVLVVCLVLVALFSAVGFASIHGLFEGYPIIKVIVDGQEIKGDVPAINFKGRTMVPVRFVSEALGADITWDAKNETVIITSSGTEKPTAEAPTTSVIGNSRRNPAGIGTRLTIEREDLLSGKIKLEIELREIVSGEAAWNMIRQANQFNDPPGEGKEYILAKFRVKILDSAEDKPLDLNHAMFTAVSEAGVVYSDFISIVPPEPNLRTDLYEGAEHVGWTYFLVNKTDNPVAAFDRSRNSERWFKLRP